MALTETNVMWDISAQKVQTNLFPVTLGLTAANLWHPSVIHAPVDISVSMVLTHMIVPRDSTVQKELDIT